MKHRFASEIVALFLVMDLVAACSATGDLVVSQAPSEPIAHDKTVALSVIPDAGSSDPRFEEVADLLRGELYFGLVFNQVFKFVVHAPKPSDYRLDVRVTEVHEISKAARVLLAPFAGRDDIRLKVGLYNQATGSLVTSFEVEVQSAANRLSWETAIHGAIREAARQVADALS